MTAQGIYKCSTMRGHASSRYLSQRIWTGRTAVVEHTAKLYSPLRFVGIEIYTLCHGKVGDLHVGISGLLGEICIKNLSLKTRRGLEGPRASR
jgi:hypothetical protein